MLIKLVIYPHETPQVCPCCLINPSLGETDSGIVGCRFCQKKTDDYVAANYVVIKEGDL